MGLYGNENSIKERTISTLDELLIFIGEYSDRKSYFRGENKNNEETACLPQIFRKKNGKNVCHNINAVGDRDNLWFTKKLESLGVGTPYNPPKDDSVDATITSVFLNDPFWCWRIWGEEKAEALMEHYAPDFCPLEDLLEKTDWELSGASFISTYLDITSDIIVALHFACSRFKFKSENEGIPSEKKTIEDGYIFVFDLNGIENSKYIKLVSYPSYTYFYKNGKEILFQPFDRITHQKGSFLAPKNYENSIDYCKYEKEIKDYISEKIILKSEVKKEIYKIFGSEDGLNYYFPKIPLSSPKYTNIAKAYNSMEGITILE